jgi:hypothetical protein
MMITLSEKRSGFLLGKSVLASAVIRIRAGRNVGEGYAPAAGVPAPSAGAAPTTELAPAAGARTAALMKALRSARARAPQDAIGKFGTVWRSWGVRGIATAARGR